MINKNFMEIFYVSIVINLIQFKTVVCNSTQTFYIHPDTGLNISQLLNRHGYPFEHHVVQTKDGYILGLHRVPFGRQNIPLNGNRLVVLLVHGIISQSIDFVNNEPERSIGLLLADRGYDVWLLNCRGNTHSRKHVHLDPDVDNNYFWDFSWHELGIYDVPQTIDYILDYTKQKSLFYIGHSQGSTAFFVMASMLPEYNKKIRHMTALAPAVFFAHSTTIVQILASFQKQLQILFKFLNIQELYPHSDTYLHVVKQYCLEGMKTFEICVALVFYITGYSPTELDMLLLPVYFSNSPSGISVKDISHYLQLANNPPYFRQYDYGSESNMKRYGQKTPPEYKLDNVITPVSIHYTKADIIIDYRDVEILASQLRNATKRLIPLEHFTHKNFIWGNNVKSLLYDYIFEEMEKY